MSLRYHARVRAYFITNRGQSTQLNIGQPSKVNHPNMICIVDPFVIPHSVVIRALFSFFVSFSFFII